MSFLGRKSYCSCTDKSICLNTLSIRNSSPKASIKHVMKETELQFHISDKGSFQPSHTVSENYFPFFVNCFDYELHVSSMDIWRQ